MSAFRPPHASLDRIIEIALAAGNAAMGYYGRCTGVEKQGAGPVTAADRAAHDLIVEALREWDPVTPVISEESPTAAYEERCGWDRFWLVDPLDGTKEFLAGNGEFTVNIALIERGEPVMGVIVAPALGTCYFAARGRGAWLQCDHASPRRIRAASGPRSVTRVVESRSHPSPELEAFVATLGPVERIPLGSSLKFCRVADGSADIYPRFGRTMEWDVAAGDCIYRNSGPDGRELRSTLRYNQPSLSNARFVIGGR
jgi:3'(2'), 5'-bisphosphate nucleotidase